MNESVGRAPNPHWKDLDRSEVVFKNVTEVPTDALFEFYSRVFPDRAEWLAGHNRWWYRIGVLPGIEPVVAVARGIVIGHLGMRPAFLRLNGQQHTAVWLENLAVLPEASGMRLGTRLSKIFAGCGYHQIGLGNDASFRLFVRRGGWVPVHVFRCALPLTASNIPRVRASVGRVVPAPLLNVASYAYAAIQASPGGSFDAEPLPEDVEGLVSSFDERVRGNLEFIHDRDWIRWRLLECPFRDEYRIIHHEDAAVIVRLIRSSSNKRINIVWCTPGKSVATMRALLGRVIRWGLDSKADLIWTVTNSPDFRRAARLALPLQNSFSMGVCTPDEAFRTEFLQPGWSLFPIETDLDLMTRA